MIFKPISMPFNSFSKTHGNPVPAFKRNCFVRCAATDGAHMHVQPVRHDVQSHAHLHQKAEFWVETCDAHHDTSSGGSV